VELSTPNTTFRDKTINGNLLVNAEGVTLQNIRIKGTLFLDPGKDGSATLDSVQATRIVVLSGADRSIYLKETKADSLVVSSSSDVHVVAETGTNLGFTLVQSTATVESQKGANVGLLVAQPQREAAINVQLQGTFSNDVSLSGSVKLTATDGAVVPTVKVTVMRGETVVGTATADETGAYTVTLNEGVTLAKDDVLSIIAKAPDKAMSEALSVTVVEAQTTQPTVMGTVGAGETMIMGTAEAGATVSVKRSEIEIGTATADETKGTYMVTLNDGVTLAEADVLSITAIAPDKSESDATSVTVVAALDPTTPPTVTGTVRAGDTTISGTTDAEAKVCVMRDETVIGTATADETGAYTVTLNEGVILAKDEVLSIIAKAPDKAISEAVSVTVAEAEVTPEAAEAEATPETPEAQ